MPGRLIAAIAITLAAASTGQNAVAHAGHSSAVQRFTFTGKTVDGKDLPITASATGPIDGRATVRIIEGAKTSAATFAFAKGTIDVVFTHGPTHAHPDPSKCRATIDAGGSYRIDGGTGRYTGATGKGTYTETRLLLGARTTAGKCIGGRNVPPKSITAVATMKGTISLKQ